MSWIAVHIGTNRIVASALDAGRNVVPLLICEDVAYSTNLSSDVFIDDENVFWGEKALLLGAIMPQNLDSEWMFRGNRQRKKCLRSLFKLLKQSAIEFYHNDKASIVVITDDEADEELLYEAKKQFVDVKQLSPYDVIIQTISPVETKITIVAELGYSALNISVIDNKRILSISREDTLGVNSINLGTIVEKNLPSSFGVTEKYVVGSLLQCNLSRLLHGENIVLPIFNTNVINELQEEYSTQLKHYTSRCIEAINTYVKKIHKSWEDFDSILFYGEGAEAFMSQSSFDDYMSNNGKKIKIIKYDCNPSELLVTYAMRIPLRANGGVIVKF